MSERVRESEHREKRENKKIKKGERIESFFVMGQSSIFSWVCVHVKKWAGLGTTPSIPPYD